MKFLVSLLCVLAFSGRAAAKNFLFRGKAPLTVVTRTPMPSVLRTAVDMFADDYRQVFGENLRYDTKKGDVHIGILGDRSGIEKNFESRVVHELARRPEGFAILSRKGNLYILGRDAHGAAYGVLELSRMIGVSPWSWWADVTPRRQEQIEVPDGFFRIESPSVRFRGIFLNDEDWGLTPWSWQTHEPSEIEGQIGPVTHARIFELLLRLRANSFWPAMHGCSVPFYFTPGNKEVADKYGIYVGGSHCEPMMRNTNGEWRVAGEGDYNFITNREAVLAFWEERVGELSGSRNIYTLGMRGVHDGPMHGVKTVEEYRDALQELFAVQRGMLSRHIDPDVTRIPQVFIPYKEVLDAYRAGLKVPDDVTLVWCDDNHGYIRQLPDAREQKRSGGSGVYYHISYWGKPHDYLWLATTHPGLIYTQMTRAYEHNVRDVWILNVGDIKPAEYLTEFFLDLAWNINGVENSREGLERHLYGWMEREFGTESAGALTQIMNEYYRLAWIRRPEFMGNTRVEEKDPLYSVVKDLPWSRAELEGRLAEYGRLADAVNALAGSVAPDRRDAFFQLVEYPVLAAGEMNKKNDLRAAGAPRIGRLVAQRPGLRQHRGADGNVQCPRRREMEPDDGFSSAGIARVRPGTA